MSNINYKNIALRELKDFSDKFENYSLGEILYSVMRQITTDVKSIKILRSYTDEEIYTFIDKAKEIEEEQ